MSNAVHPIFADLLDSVSGRPRRRHAAPLGECKYCDGERQRQNAFFPPHDASHRCESGKREHCTCDTCF